MSCREALRAASFSGIAGFHGALGHADGDKARAGALATLNRCPSRPALLGAPEPPTVASGAGATTTPGGARASSAGGAPN